MTEDGYPGKFHALPRQEIAPERRREIASMGGQAAQAKGTAHRWNAETGRAAGLKGGAASVAARARKKAAQQ